VDFYSAEIVMTPSKHGTTTSIRIQKVKKSQIDQSQVAHTAGGQHRGLVINKQSAAGMFHQGPLGKITKMVHDFSDPEKSRNCSSTFKK